MSRPPPRALVVGAVLVLLLGCQSTRSTVSQDPPLSAHRLLFVKATLQAYELWETNGSGAKLNRLVTVPLGDYHGHRGAMAVSPDGQWVAISGGDQVAIHHLSTKETRRVQAQVCPDGMAFRRDGTLFFSDGRQLFSISPKAAAPVRLWPTRKGSVDLHPRPTSDGLLFLSRKAENPLGELELWGARGSEKPLRLTPSGRQAFEPVANGAGALYWAPVKGVDGMSRSQLFALEGAGEEQQLTSDPWNSLKPTRGPGRSVYYLVNRAGTQKHLYRLEQDLSSTQLTRTVDVQGGPAVSACGRWVAILTFDSDLGTRTLKLVPAKGGEPTLLYTYPVETCPADCSGWTPSDSPFAWVVCSC